ncbi:MAG: hypothetical protein ACI910_000399 [Oleispira sp.]|jgi:hypothetical protein
MLLGSSDNVEIALWKYNSESPVIFMIDDLANIYFDCDTGDWGGRCSKKGGLYDYLKNKIIRIFPEVKFTFFLVSGKREVQRIGDYDFVQECNKGEFPDLLKKMISDKHEIAYHGYDHGSIVDGNLIQEWTNYRTLTEALEKIEFGVTLIQDSTDSCVKGGKYCGYESGDFGHDSIVDSGFEWWFDSLDTRPLVRPHGVFRDGVFYMPSNIDCSVYSIRLLKYYTNKKYLKSLYRQILSGTLESKIKQILSVNGIVSLQEHSSPIRTDGVRQYPNVFDDISSILYILGLLCEYDIWWATASEVADYSRCREYLKIVKKTDSCFSFGWKGEGIHKPSGCLTLIVSTKFSGIRTSEEFFPVYIKDGNSLVDVTAELDVFYYLVNT